MGEGAGSAAARAIKADRHLTLLGVAQPNPGNLRLLPLPSVMASPPTFTRSAGNGPSAISGSVRLLTTNPAFRYFGGDMVLQTALFPFTFVVNNWVTAHPVSMGYMVEFETDADRFEFYVINGQSGYEVWIDGQPTTAAPRTDVTNDGLAYVVLVDFGSARSSGRRVELLFKNGTRFGGVFLSKLFSAWRSRTPKGPRLTVVGDSWGQGTGALAHFRGFGHIAARCLGIRDVWQCSIGGTGYVATGNIANFGQHVPADVFPYATDEHYLLLEGGTNDDNDQPTTDAVQPAAAALFDAITAAIPKTKLIVLGPTDVKGQPGTRTYQVRNALRTECVRVGGVFIDPFGGTNFGAADHSGQWITGTGRINNQTGDGNADLYINTDAAHPTDDGHAFYGVKIAADLAAWIDAGCPRGAIVENGAVR